MYCPNCGKKNDIDALFCENCGARLIIPTSSAQPASASAVSTAARSTSSAADSQAPAASEATATEPTTRSAQHARQNDQPSSQSKTPWLILIVILVVILGGGYYWLGHQRQSNSVTTTAESSSSAAVSTKTESSSSSKASASTTTQPALWSATKSSELASFMSSWQDTMNQSYEGTYDGQSVTVGTLSLPSDIKHNQYQDKITVNGDKVKLKWTASADTAAKYQVVAAATDLNASSGVITYLYVFHNGSPDVLVSQDGADTTTFNFTSSQNTDLQDGFAKIANAD